MNQVDEVLQSAEIHAKMKEHIATLGWRTDLLAAPRDSRFVAHGYYKNSNNARLEFIHWAESINGWVDDEGYPFAPIQYQIITPPTLSHKEAEGS